MEVQFLWVQTEWILRNKPSSQQCAKWLIYRMGPRSFQSPCSSRPRAGMKWNECPISAKVIQYVQLGNPQPHVHQDPGPAASFLQSLTSSVQWNGSVSRGSRHLQQCLLDKADREALETWHVQTNYKPPSDDRFQCSGQTPWPALGNLELSADREHGNLRRPLGDMGSAHSKMPLQWWNCPAFRFLSLFGLVLVISDAMPHSFQNFWRSVIERVVSTKNDYFQGPCSFRG